METENLSDDELHSALLRAVVHERESLISVLTLLYLADNRRLALRRSHTSTFDYCVRELGYSEGAAYRRIHVARASKKYPALLSFLAEGLLSLGAASMLVPHLTLENVGELLSRAVGKTKRELEFMIATLAPEEPKRDFIRQERAPEPVEPPPLELPVFAPPPPSPPRQTIAPTAAERARMAFDCSKEFLDLFERAREVLRHRYPAGRCEEILEAALEALLDRKDRNRRPKPRKRRQLKPRRSRYIPDEVKHEVWHRDDGRCTHENKDGSRCRERGGLEFDHIIPYSLGGSSQDAANIRLLCRRHNQAAAEEAFGELAKGRRRI